MDIMFGGKGKMVSTLVASNANMARDPKKLNHFVFRTETVDILFCVFLNASQNMCRWY